MGQRLAGNRSVMGLMLESHLFGGAQKLAGPPGKLRYGVSITDECLDWISTERCLRATHAALAEAAGGDKIAAPDRAVVAV